MAFVWSWYNTRAGALSGRGAITTTMPLAYMRVLIACCQMCLVGDPDPTVNKKFKTLSHLVRSTHTCTPNGVIAEVPHLFVFVAPICGAVQDADLSLLLSSREFKHELLARVSLYNVKVMVCLPSPLCRPCLRVCSSLMLCSSPRSGKS